MITVEPFFLPVGEQSSDPRLLGITRGLAQTYEPLLEPDLPDRLMELVRRLDERERTGGTSSGGA